MHLNSLRNDIRYCDCIINYTTMENNNKLSISSRLFANRCILKKSGFLKKYFEEIIPEVTILDKSIYNTYEIILPFSELILLKCIDLLYNINLNSIKSVNLINIIDLVKASLYLKLDDAIMKEILLKLIKTENGPDIDTLYNLIIDICNSDINNNNKSIFLSRILYKLNDNLIDKIKQNFSEIFPKKYYRGKTFIDNSANNNKIVLSNSSKITHNGINYTTCSTIDLDHNTEHKIILIASPVEENDRSYNYKNIIITLYKKFEEPRNLKIKIFDENEESQENNKKNGKYKIPCPPKYVFNTERCKYGCIFYTEEEYDNDYNYEVEITD